MLEKIAELEKRLEEASKLEEYEARVAGLEAIIEEHDSKKYAQQGPIESARDAAIYLALPLLLLLGAHDLITVVYDAKMVYLRIISMLLPLPFGYFLFKGQRRHLFSWFTGAVFLAIASVLGMSWITSLVDQSPILPQNNFEWREVLEYSASIAFSFLTGMLLGRVAYAHNHQRKYTTVNPFAKAILSMLGKEGFSPETIHNLMKKVNEYGGTVVALATTALSIYTGLKHVL